MTEKKKNCITIVLLLAAAVLMTTGFLRGEVALVLKKSINICLECIGIG